MPFVAHADSRGLIDGATTLELDNGITAVGIRDTRRSTISENSLRQDGHVVVWHDEEVTAEKCIDTEPVVSTLVLVAAAYKD